MKYDFKAVEAKWQKVWQESLLPFCSSFFVYGFSEKSENKYSNISIALLFSSPTKNEPRSHAALTLAQYFY